MRTLVVAAFAAAALAAGRPALGEDGIGAEGCGARADVATWLARHFEEAPLARGVQGDGRLFELYAGKAGATWTVVVTDPAGESCIVSEGTSLEVLPHDTRSPIA
jgi:hypothetical protein